MPVPNHYRLVSIAAAQTRDGAELWNRQRKALAIATALHDVDEGTVRTIVDAYLAEIVSFKPDHELDVVDLPVLPPTIGDHSAIAIATAINDAAETHSLDLDRFVLTGAIDGWNVLEVAEQAEAEQPVDGYEELLRYLIHNGPRDAIRSQID